MGSRVALSYTKYFKEDEYGNLSFFAERLTGLTAFSHEKSAESAM
jgi:hypothetical protein